MCGEYTDYTRSHRHPGAQFWVGLSRNWSVFLERPNTGCHEKAPVRCPCSRLAALHGAPRTHLVLLDADILSLVFVIIDVSYIYIYTSITLSRWPLIVYSCSLIGDPYCSQWSLNSVDRSMVNWRTERCWLGLLWVMVRQGRGNTG